jgi:hypothetical protein
MPCSSSEALPLPLPIDDSHEEPNLLRGVLYGLAFVAPCWGLTALLLLGL